MARTQIKLLIFLVTVGVVAVVLGGAYLMYRDVLMHDASVTQSIAADRAPGKPATDFGVRRFEAAVALVREAKLEEAREALYKLLQQFPRSRACNEARRIIGEMNMDALYRLDGSGGKQDYIVQPRDSLLGIVAKHHTTLEALTRLNSLTTINLQPGEHLLVIPMEFDLAVDVSEKKVTLLRGGRFFKQYDAISVKLPQLMRVPVELQVSNKSAVIGSKPANPVAADYVDAEKRIVASKNTTSAGLIMRTPPLAQPITAAAKVEDDAQSATGIFLAHEDLEEIYPLLRKGSKFSLVQ